MHTQTAHMHGNTYTHIHKCAHINAYTHIHMSTGTYTYTWKYGTHTYKDIHTYTCTHIYTCINMHCTIHIYIHIDIWCTYTYIHVYKHIRICAYTHRHTFPILDSSPFILNITLSFNEPQLRSPSFFKWASIWGSYFEGVIFPQLLKEWKVFPKAWSTVRSDCPCFHETHWPCRSQERGQSPGLQQTWSTPTWD